MSSFSHANLINGDFEDGLAGWTTQVFGSANPIERAEGETTAQGGGTIPASPTDDHYVFTSQSGPAASYLTQSFTVSEGLNKVFFDLFVRNQASDFIIADTLDWDDDPNQRARVDILVGGAPIDTLEEADIIVNAFETQPGDPLVQDWRTFEVDVSDALAPYVGQEVVFRFAQVDNQNFFNFAIDNVNVGETQVPGDPEPADALPVNSLTSPGMVLLIGLFAILGLLAVQTRRLG
ncbi:MAG: hypothetical protein EA419_11380 [Wenzhouxiangella sp.]|nr:MAG: hypothetical protein EA419_11380 [Wenzhouxiangella sp.]